MSFKNLNTGDLVLCHGESKDGIINNTIEFFTNSIYEHVGLIIKDPWWTNLKGIYVLQSSKIPKKYKDVINNKLSGVTLNKLEDFISERDLLSVRSIQNINWTYNQKNKFKNIFHEVHSKPYNSNLIDLCKIGLSSYFRCNKKKIRLINESNKFICSSLISYFYIKLGWCNTNINWSTQTPEDLSKIKLNNPYKFSKIWKLK